jgi:hypothetical protein
MAVRGRMTDAVESARPYAERLARDDELHDHVRKAYDSARRVYDDVLGDRGPTGAAMRVARDKDLQDDLRNTLTELRQAGRRLQKAEESHTGRNLFLLLLGVAIGVLFNPATGPDTRRWLKDKVFGPEEPFEAYEPVQEP